MRNKMTHIGNSTKKKIILQSENKSKQDTKPLPKKQNQGLKSTTRCITFYKSLIEDASCNAMSKNRQMVVQNQREKDAEGSKQADLQAVTEGKLREIDGTKENEFLSKALNYVVRDEIRHAAYLRDKIQDVIQKYSQLEGHFMLTGSAGEGMINSNDWDLMFCMPEFVVIDTEHEFKHNNKKIYLLADTAQCNLGFTRLKLIENEKQTAESIGAFKSYFRYYNGAYYLSTHIKITPFSITLATTYSQIAHSLMYSLTNVMGRR